MKIFISIFIFIASSVVLLAQSDTSKVFSLIRNNDTIIEATSNADTMLLYSQKSLISLEEISADILQKKYLNKKAEIIDQICIAYYYNGEYDKAMEYATTELRIYHRLKKEVSIASVYNTIGLIYAELGNKALALDYYLKALEIDNKYNDKDKIATRYNNIGNIYLDISEYEKAIEYFDKCIDIYLSANDTTNIYYSYNNIASAYRRQGKYSEAIQYFNFSLRIINKGDDYKSMSTCLSNIGVVYQDWGSYDKALQYFKEALVYSEKTGNLISTAIKYNNIASAFKQLEYPDSAIFYFNKSKTIFEDYGLLKYASTVNTNIGNVYLDNKKYKKALEIYLSSLEIDLKYNDYQTITKTYSKIGNAYRYMGNKQKAIFYFNKVKDIADSLSILPVLSDNYHSLSNVYNEIGDYKKSLYYLQLHNQINDSIFSENNQKQMNEFDVMYRTLKKEAKISLLEKEKSIDKLSIENKNVTLKNQKIFISAVIIGLLLSIIFVFFLLKQIKAKKLANNLLLERNEEVNQQKEEITAQRDEIVGQKETVESHLQVIEMQKEVLTDSIQYAKHIQNAVLPEQNEMKNIFNESFIFYKPKDIISGDFYWFKSYESNGEKYRVVASVDSTGHGVPGALMSMLGISFLTEVFNKHINCNNPAKVLDLLRERVIKALKQRGESGEAKDGFDMALCIINDTKKELLFAGANTNLRLLRNNKLDVLNSTKTIKGKEYSVYEFKGDRMPISITRRKSEEFSNTRIKLIKGDNLYLMTDGYVDQFGGENGGKFKSKKLNTLLIDIQKYNMDKQSERIVQEFNDWRICNGVEYEQTDDILVIGISI